MEEAWLALLGVLISGGITLIGIFVSSRNTRDELTNKLNTNQEVMKNEINHVKDEMQEIKNDVKSHNNYAKLFAENIPVIKEQIKVANHRIDDIEHKIG